MLILTWQCFKPIRKLSLDVQLSSSEFEHSTVEKALKDPTLFVSMLGCNRVNEPNPMQAWGVSSKNNIKQL